MSIEPSEKITERRSGLRKTLGPGILYAGAAIGASHIVQSTKAGALYGFGLIWAILLINLFKYPFFEFCRRYTAATGETVIRGYNRLGKGWAICYLAISVGTGYINIAAVTAVTAALAGHLFFQSLSMFWWIAIVALFCTAILALGHYPALDSVTKIVVSILALSTLIAFVAAVIHGSAAPPDFQPAPIWDKVGIAFIIALMGWMPTPIDAAAWPSLWAVERKKQTGYTPTFREARFDFNFGYVSSTFLAVIFLGLGALVMFGTGQTPAPQGPAFAQQFVSLYTNTLGTWSYYFIAAAAFSCMFSTALTVYDGYARAIISSFREVFGLPAPRRKNMPYSLLMLSFFVFTLLITAFLMQTMGGLLDFATVVAFLTAPVLAILNHCVVRAKFMPAEARPPRWLWLLSILGIVFLTGFSLLYVAGRLFI